MAEADLAAINLYSDTRRTARILYGFTSLILLGLVTGVAIVLGNSLKDTVTAGVITAGIAPVLGMYYLIARQKYEATIIGLSLLVMALMTVLATLGNGIHHLTTFCYPVVLIIASLVSRRRTMIFLTAVAIACAGWLVFGELAGLYTPAVLVHSVAGDFFTVAIFIILTAVMTRSVAAALFESNRQLQIELQERKRTEQRLEEDIALRREAEDQINTLNTELEDRVRARTAELEAANNDLARANRAKDDFLASMSHELRTPLNAILSRAESLAEGIYDPLGERQLRAVEVIDRSGQHLLGLINDVLDLARIEAGTLKPALSQVVAPDACRAALELVAGQAQAKGLGMQMELDPLVDELRADERQLRQMLVNLLANAVKFTPPGGQIGLEVRGDAAGSRALFSVWDTGIGIAPADMERLFRPFTQLDSGLNRQYEGTGLGLALVKRLAVLGGGDVTAASTPAYGSRFTFWLPWTPPGGMGELTGETEAGQPAPRPATLLLAEDNPATQNAYLDYFTALGYTVEAAANGAETIALARKIHPDLILMDVQMPGMSGLEAMRFLRADPAFQATPILAVTALSMPGDRERCLAAGANDYLTKPVSLKRLGQIIAGLLQTQAK